MQASRTDMLMYDVPRLTTMADSVSLISFAIAETSSASTSRAVMLALLSLILFLRLMLFYALPTLRLAIQTFPNTSLFWGALWAATCATAPAPTMSTFGFISDSRSRLEPSYDKLLGKSAYSNSRTSSMLPSSRATTIEGIRTPLNQFILTMVERAGLS